MMSWYYAGPNAQPVGPLTLEELKSRRFQGLLTDETYIIEQTGEAGLAWKRYRELFPGLPPIPTETVPGEYMPQLGALAPSPALTSSLPPPVPTLGTAVSKPIEPTLPTNQNALLGFWFGLGSMPLFFCCLLGVPLAIPGALFSLLALIQVRRRDAKEKGTTYALCGLAFSLFTLLLFIGLVLIFLARGTTSFSTSFFNNDGN